jgi:putative FmdB family regulatory protein
MPIYEFYCGACHRVFQFLARRPGTRKRPPCPRCGGSRLERRASGFAISRGRAEPVGDGLPADLDDATLERAVGALSSEAESLDENDPRQAARLMRRLYEVTGMPMDAAVQDAVRRMEAGEDPERVEEDLGDLFGEPEAAGHEARIRGLARRVLPPSVDPTLHEL